MSVNLSARQFTQPDLVDQIAEILAETGLEPSSLELEITECGGHGPVGDRRRALRRLRELGVRLVLDDFGTGYSSLSYLKHLPLDTIKIDRSFVAGLEAAADRSIVEAVIALAHGLGIGVVARGHRDRHPAPPASSSSVATLARATCSPARSRRRMPATAEAADPIRPRRRKGDA